MKQPRVFTDEEVATILTLYQEGKGSSIISKHLHTSTNKIMEVVKANGADPVKMGRKATGKSKKATRCKPIIDIKPLNDDDMKTTELNLLSMPEDYNKEVAGRLQELINMEVIPNLTIGSDTRKVTVDLCIPSIGMIVITAATEEDYLKWKSGVDGFWLTETMRLARYGSAAILYKGDEALKQEVERIKSTFRRR